MTVNVILPWPPKELSPNFRGHWAKLARAKKAYRLACKSAGCFSVRRARLVRFAP